MIRSIKHCIESKMSAAGSMVRPAAILAAVSLVGPGAYAGSLGTVELDFLSNSDGSLGPTRLGAKISYSGPNGDHFSNSSVGVGQLHFEVTDTSGLGDDLFNEGDVFATFCTDIFQSVQSSQTLDIIDLEDAPDPGGPMGSFKSSLLRGLFATHLNDAIQTANTAENRLAAATFQAMVWEIVNEDFDSDADSASDLGFDLDDGDFEISFNNSSQDEDIQDLADEWLDDLWDNKNSSFQLWAGTDGDAQDQLLYLVPAPPAALFGLAGLVIVGVLRKRR